jgi:hypothetical protein
MTPNGRLSVITHFAFSQFAPVRKLAALAVLAALLLLAPALSLAQQTPQRGWTDTDLRQWLSMEGGKPLQQAAFQECKDNTARRDAIMNGNLITTQIFNFGSISAPGNRITNIVWNGLGYGYEFGPFVGARVPVTRPDGTVTDTVIVSDGLVSGGGEVSPTGNRWGWQPIPCAEPVGGFDGLQVVNPDSDKIPTNDARDDDLDGKPDSWPEEFFNAAIGDYVWPGALQQGASNAEKETLYFMNDYNNCEFNYDPFPSDPDRNCGLGLEVETRIYQWSNPLAEDAIFLIYKITNKSERDLREVAFGMWGDPHVGGANNWQDDLAFYDRDLNMVYAWDADGRSDIAGREPGYFGYKFLESPGIGIECIGASGSTEAECLGNGGSAFFQGDGIDNDGDGYIDESWTDGIDNDGDWDPEKDDVGQDGVAGTGDLGEGDGIPTPGSQFDITLPGEPNFEFTDIDESDMIGLTSFAAPPFSAARIQEDQRVYDQYINPGQFDDVPSQPGDYVFIYGSGHFDLRAGETKRFSIALLLGANLNDLLLNAETVQQIYDVGYRFARPPEKPTVRAIPGDRKVTLYWDDVAEQSFDPLTGENDFEGYVIYRSTMPDFSDQQLITDVNGTPFLFRPLTNERGVEAKFDLDNGVTGPSVIRYSGRGVSYDLGDDTGLFHTYVDSSDVVNGQTYFYSVVAYDRGFAGDAAGFTGGIPPTETTKTITYDPTTDQYTFDTNTVSVTHSARVAGYVAPAAMAVTSVANARGTGDIEVEIVDELEVMDGVEYRIVFEEVGGEMLYSVVNGQQVTTTIPVNVGRPVSVGKRNVVTSSFSLATKSGTPLTLGTDFELSESAGVVTLLSDVNADSLVAQFNYAPLYRASELSREGGVRNNLVFEGLRVFVDDEPLGIDEEETGWAEGTASADFTVRQATAGPRPISTAADYEIRFAGSNVSTSLGNPLPLPFQAFNLTEANQEIQLFVTDNNGNGEWDVTEPIIFIETIGGALRATWQVNFEPGAGKPGAGDVFYLRTAKPFVDGDTFAFMTEGAFVDPEQAAQGLENIYVVPNPYVAFNEIEPANPFSRLERGERRLYFANLPQRATIRIYTLAGELVDVIEHDSPMDQGNAYWNLRTKDNMNIAYGLYFYHVDAPEGEFTGKFAVIK